MVYVCDAIMGSGKSQSAISYINEHPEKRFVYITPYIDETERIKESCPNAKFVLPTSNNPGNKFSKVEHTRKLLMRGCNISTTHSAFRMYTSDMIDNIKKWDYVLIIDEAVNVLTESSECSGDVDMLIRAGYIAQDETGKYVQTGVDYPGGKLDTLFEMLKRNGIVRISESNRRDTDNVMFWELYPDVMKAFNNAFILTYLFDGQDIRYYLDVNKIPFQRIGVKRDGDVYHFADTMEYYPQYIHQLDRMIDILDNDKLNSIGNGKYALSAGWFNKASTDDVKKLKNNIYNYFHNYNRGTPSDTVMWASFKEHLPRMKMKSYSNRITPCNMRAVNTYRDKTVLAYCVNLFVNPFKKRYFTNNGYDYNEDAYALSTMVQWIWRSAIRDGKPISIYIPSERMRTLLMNWIKDTMESVSRNEGG